jgi:hypothetical protein
MSLAHRSMMVCMRPAGPEGGRRPPAGPALRTWEGRNDQDLIRDRTVALRARNKRAPDLRRKLATSLLPGQSLTRIVRC